MRIVTLNRPALKTLTNTRMISSTKVRMEC
ncbi:putative transcription factor IIIc-like protein, conidia-enriched transcript [Histoplasma capsulatum]|uniref:Putative transcription factor IIIc-like protein, conidia-enriched transcript n=1 Tax=Ajellomyces capsulatus TaxID=5037 RepID=A0A8A1M355_AJECA|nr:putative transcription factor IIIc-like protein, conidia-enriched transcript [Histoplasma capsulatum]